MNSRIQRPGFTLLELLIVIGIIALIVGMLLPAIQGVRSQAVKLKSMNKLMQIILATHNYASAYGGALPGYPRSLTGADGPGTFVPILPFLEAENRRIPNPYHDSNWEYVPAYISPADPSFASPLKGPGSTPRSFINISGDHSYPANWQAFQLGSNLNSSFSDGTSNTIAFAERYARCFETATFWLLTRDNCVDPVTWQPAICTDNTGNRRPTFADVDYDDVQPITVDGVTRPSVAGQTFQVAPTIEACNYRVPQTPHTGGMLTAFFDGSVRITSPRVSPEVFWSAVTPAGGETVSDW